MTTTAFLVELDGGNGLKYQIRWFTPILEISLCGHATMGALKVLFERIKRPEEEKETTLRLESKSAGVFDATFDRKSGRIKLFFPSNFPIPLEPKDHQWLRDLLRLTLEPLAGLDQVLEVGYNKKAGATKLLLRLKGEISEETESESLLAKLRPDFRGLEKVKDNDLILGIIVTVQGAGKVDFYSRFFAPWIGIDEDPFCGSAHTMLAPVWSKFYPGKKVLTGKMLSERRSLVYCHLDEEGGKVGLEGSARIVIRGELQL